MIDAHTQCMYAKPFQFVKIMDYIFFFGFWSHLQHFGLTNTHWVLFFFEMAFVALFLHNHFDFRLYWFSFRTGMLQLNLLIETLS